MLVTPCSTRSKAILAKREHALRSCHSPYLIGTLALDDEPLYRLRHEHDLVDAHAALVAGVVAAGATHRSVESDLFPLSIASLVKPT